MESLPPDLANYLRRIADSQDYQRKMFKWLLILALPFIALVTVAHSLLEPLLQRKQKETPPMDWYAVDSYRREGELAKALAAADQLLIRSPRDFELLYKKGQIQLMLGDKQSARQSFQAAAEIFPVHPYKQAYEAMSLPDRVEPTNSPQP